MIINDHHGFNHGDFYREQQQEAIGIGMYRQKNVTIDSAGALPPGWHIV